MKHLLIAAALAAATVTVPAAFAANVGISINIGEPGFYGQLDMGNIPQPQVVYAQPITIEGNAMNRPPIYLHVPRGYAKHWRKHCHEYNACGERVFFVRDSWYKGEYVRHYKEQHHDVRHEERREDRHEERRGDHY